MDVWSCGIILTAMLTGGKILMEKKDLQLRHIFYRITLGSTIGTKSGV